MYVILHNAVSSNLQLISSFLFEREKEKEREREKAEKRNMEYGIWS